MAFRECLPCSRNDLLSPRHLKDPDDGASLDQVWKTFRPQSKKEADGKVAIPEDSASAPSDENRTKIVHVKNGTESITVTSPAEMTKILLEDRYPVLHNYDGKSDFESVFVPKTYISKNPSLVRDDVEEEKVQRVGEKDSIERRKAVGAFRQDKGETTEREVYMCLKNAFPKNVLSIRGLEMGDPDPNNFKSNESKKEIDFTQVLVDQQVILNIECKRNLTMEPHQRKRKGQTIIETEFENVLNQHEKGEKCVKNWFQYSLKARGWKYMKIIYCDKMSDNLPICDNKCRDYLACGHQELVEKINQIRNPDALPKDHPDVVEDFKLLSRYLLFCVSIVEMSTAGRLLEHVRKAQLEEAGSLENIKLWFFLYGDQIEILRMPFVVFVGTFGTGKTLLSFEHAKNLCEDIILGRISESKVAMVTFTNKCGVGDQDTLLVHDFKLRIPEKYRNHLDVINYPYEADDNFQDLEIILKNYDYVVIDEVFEANENQFRQLGDVLKTKRSCWMAISGVLDPDQGFQASFGDQGRFVPIGPELYENHAKEVQDKLQRSFPGFYIPTLEWPVRNAGNILRHMKQQTSVPIDPPTQQGLLKSCKVSENLSEGVIGNIFARTFIDGLIAGIKKFQANDRILVVLGKGIVEAFTFLNSIDSQSSHDPIEYFAQFVQETFLNNGRKQPLILLKGYRKFESLIDGWIECKVQGDLVTTAAFVSGFENHHVLHIRQIQHNEEELHGDSENNIITPAIVSRATYQVVMVRFKLFLEQKLTTKVMMAMKPRGLMDDYSRPFILFNDISGAHVFETELKRDLRHHHSTQIVQSQPGRELCHPIQRAHFWVEKLGESILFIRAQDGISWLLKSCKGGISERPFISFQWSDNQDGFFGLQSVLVKNQVDFSWMTRPTFEEMATFWVANYNIQFRYWSLSKPAKHPNLVALEYKNLLEESFLSAISMIPRARKTLFILDEDLESKDQIVEEIRSIRGSELAQYVNDRVPIDAQVTTRDIVTTWHNLNESATFDFVAWISYRKEAQMNSRFNLTKTGIRNASLGWTWLIKDHQLTASKDVLAFVEAYKARTGTTAIPKGTKNFNLTMNMDDFRDASNSMQLQS